MSDGRMVWRARDCGWYLREWIVALGEEFGAHGPSVIAWLEDQAKLQNDGGRVKTGPRAVSRGSFVNDVDTVGHVLSRSVTLGLLVDYEERDGRFECVISWFAADQGKAMAANRKARQRAGTPVGPDDPAPVSRPVPDGPGGSRSVSKSPPTRQDKTEQKDNVNTAELRSAIAECFAHWQDRCGHQQASFSDDRRSKLETRLRERRRHHQGDLDAATRDVRLAIDGAAVAPFIDDKGKRHDEITLICRSNSKLEDFMGRTSSAPAGNVVAMPARSPSLERMDAWARSPEYAEGQGAS